jgi:hypothetical protein
MNARNDRYYRRVKRSLWISWLYLLLGLIAMCSISAADSPPNEKITFEPDPEIQKLINEVAYTTGGKKEGEAFFENLDLLQKRGGKNYSKLVPNLIYYSSRGQNVREGMAAGGIIHYLGISEMQVLSALLPYVGVEDELFRKELEKLIVDLEPGFREQKGFEHIYLRGYADQGGWPPRNAMEFLYRKGPSAALLTMTKAYHNGPETEKTRAIKWAEYSVRHVLALKSFHRGDKLPEATRDAVKALDELSKFEEWWVRLYVAEILSQHPEFRTEVMATRLSFDNDELVRQAISRK